MAKKYFHIHDEEEDKDYMVEEVEATPVDEEEPAPSSETQDDDTSLGLTEEEIGKIRILLPHIDELIALIPAKTEDSDEDEDETLDEDEDEDVETQDSDEEEEPTQDSDEEEEVVDTDKVKDSFGATIKKKKTKDSSRDAHELEVAKAWSKKYSEGN